MHELTHHRNSSNASLRQEAYFIFRYLFSRKTYTVNALRILKLYEKALEDVLAMILIPLK